MTALYVVGGIFLIISLLTAWAAWSNGQRIRRIRDTPTSKVGQLRAGFREIAGRLVAADKGQTLTSPMSNTPCVYYDFVVEQQETRHHHHHSDSNRKTRHWRTVVKDVNQVPMQIDDGTGVCRLHLNDAELLLNKDHEGRTGFLRDAPAGLEEALRTRYGRSSVGLIFNKDMRYSETVLREGDTIYALGTVEGTSNKWRMVKGSDVLLVSDGNEEAAISKLHMRSLGYMVATVAMLALTAGVAWHAHNVYTAEHAGETRRRH